MTYPVQAPVGQPQDVHRLVGQIDELFATTRGTPILQDSEIGLSMTLFSAGVLAAAQNGTGAGHDQGTIPGFVDMGSRGGRESPELTAHADGLGEKFFHPVEPLPGTSRPWCRCSREAA